MISVQQVKSKRGTKCQLSLARKRMPSRSLPTTSSPRKQITLDEDYSRCNRQPVQATHRVHRTANGAVTGEYDVTSAAPQIARSRREGGGARGDSANATSGHLQVRSTVADVVDAEDSWLTTRTSGGKRHRAARRRTTSRTGCADTTSWRTFPEQRENRFSIGNGSKTKTRDD